MPPRGNHNNHNNHRGRGRGRGRPHPPGPASGTSRGPYPHANAEIDVEIQQWAEPGVSAGGNGDRTGNMNRGNGLWRGGIPKSRSGAGTPSRGVNSPRRGNSTPRGRGRGGGGGGGGGGRGRGRGRGYAPDNGLDFTPSRQPRHGIGSATKAMSMIGKDASLTELLYSERPLLRPVKFVPATLTPFLFQHSEEMLKPAADINPNTTKTPHIPSADRVAWLLHENASDSDSESGDSVQDALEEIDFADLAQIRAEVDAIVQGTATTAQDVHDAQGDIEEVDFADLGAIRAQVDAVKPQATSRDDVLKEVFTGVYNQVKDGSGTIDDESVALTPNESPVLKPSIEISNQTNHESLSYTIVIEEEVPCSSNEFLDVPTAEPSQYIAPETHPVPILSNDLSPPPDTLEHDPHPLFVIDTTSMPPLPHRSASDVILVDRAGHGETLGEDDEQIVYVAPHPRSGRVSPAHSRVPSVTLSHMSVLTGVEQPGLTSPIREDEDVVIPDVESKEEDFLSLAALSLDSPQGAKKVWKARKKEAWMQRKQQRQSKRMGFGAFGAIMSEAQLREEDAAEKRRPRWATRRRGDSDIDWGTGDEDRGEDEVDALSNGLGGMDIDADLDVDSMRGFSKSMSVEGSRFVTMDDIEDEARLRQEDEEGQGGPEGSSDSELSDDQVDGAVEDEEEEAVFNVEEKVLIAESDGDELSPDSDDDELSPRSSFQARLGKVRERGARPKADPEIPDDEEEGAEILPWTRGADDEEFFAHIHDLLEENSDILSGHDRKQKKALFRNLHEGHVDMDDAEFTTPVQRKKGKEKQFTGPLASQLKAQWAKDRAQKAALKQERAVARLHAALDPLSAEKGKASRRAMRAAARLEPSKAQSIAPHAIVDADALEAQIRRFAEDKRASMALPSMDKGARKVVHELAAVFGLKSVSKGKGKGRYTTLFRTSRTGVGVKEDKARAVMRRYAGGGRGGGGRGGRGGGKGGGMPQQKEGDEVGKEAPKIGEGNIGFRMLASMGWSEGGRIGGSSSVGIEAPLMAVIKYSKLGLGATR